MQSSTAIKVPTIFWTPKNFVRAFRNLMVPITTATETQIPKWSAAEVWGPYWASIRDFCEVDEKCQELISTVMAKTIRPELTTLEHRELLEQWVERNIPGYRLVWESELLYELNEALKSSGETVTAFSFGKDGRGALPDRYYLRLAERKLLPVGNHHDILGHFLLFTDPLIRKITERIIKVSADGQELRHELERYRRVTLHGNPEQQRAFSASMLDAMRPILTLQNFAWNIAQEKLFFSDLKSEKGRGSKARFSLMGAFNTVYNTTLSSRLSTEHADSTVAGLAIQNGTSLRNIVMLPRDMRRWLIRDDSAHVTSTMVGLRDALIGTIDAYAQVLENIGWRKDPTTAEVIEHAAHFKKLVLEGLFAQVGPFRLPINMRWKKFGRLIQADPFFSRLYQRKAMLMIAEAQIEVANAALKYQAQFFYEKGRVAPSRPAVLLSLAAN